MTLAEILPDVVLDNKHYLNVGFLTRFFHLFNSAINRAILDRLTGLKKEWLGKIWV